MQAVDPAQVTAQQQANWDRHAATYAEVVISKDDIDAATPQVISAIKKHQELASGEQVIFQLKGGRIVACAYMQLWKAAACLTLPVPLSIGAKILDIASSSGRPAVPLAKEFPHAHVISTDLSPKSVSLVHTYAQAQGVTNLTAQVADAQNLQDFADSTFKVVTCSYGLFFMPEATKALREAYRVLQPGGLFVAIVWAWPDKVQMSEVSQPFILASSHIHLVTKLEHRAIIQSFTQSSLQGAMHPYLVCDMQ